MSSISSSIFRIFRRNSTDRINKLRNQPGAIQTNVVKEEKVINSVIEERESCSQRCTLKSDIYTITIPKRQMH